MMGRRQYAAAMCLSFCVWLSACDDEVEPLTQIVVVVNSDLSVPAKLDKVTIEVTGVVGEPPRAEVAVGEEQSLPVSLGLIHRGGPLGPVTVRVVGSRDGQDIVERAVSVSFGDEQTLELQMQLTADCASCLHEETCSKKSCSAESIASLPPFDGDIGSVNPVGRAGSGGGGAGRGGNGGGGAGGIGAGGGNPYSNDAGTVQDAGGTEDAAVDSGEPSNRPPVCTITEPADGSSFVEGTTVRFSGSCTDPEVGYVYLTQWSSDRDGTLSYLDFALEHDLSVGKHVVSFCGTDPADLDLDGCTSIEVTITAKP